MIHFWSFMITMGISFNWEVNSWWSDFLIYSLSSVKLLGSKQLMEWLSNLLIVFSKVVAPIKVQNFERTYSGSVHINSFLPFLNSSVAELYQYFSFLELLWRDWIRVFKWKVSPRCTTAWNGPYLRKVWTHEWPNKCISMGATKPYFRDLTFWTLCIIKIIFIITLIIIKTNNIIIIIIIVVIIPTVTSISIRDIIVK